MSARKLGMVEVLRGAPALGWPDSARAGAFMGASRLVWGVAFAGAALGFLATGHAAQAAALHVVGRELGMLLRFMAVLKGGFALAAVALSAWRMGFAARPGITAGYVAACALMPAGAGLIWGLAHVVAGAVVFHAGLAAMLVTGWLDQEEAGDLLMRRIRARRA